MLMGFLLLVTVELILKDQYKKKLERKMELPVVLWDLFGVTQLCIKLFWQPKIPHNSCEVWYAVWLCYWYYVDTVVTLLSLSNLELSRASTLVITLSVIKSKQ